MNKRERGRCQRDEEGIQLKDCFDGTVSIRLENKLHFMVLVFGTLLFLDNNGGLWHSTTVQCSTIGQIKPWLHRPHLLAGSVYCWFWYFCGINGQSGEIQYAASLVLQIMKQIWALVQTDSVRFDALLLMCACLCVSPYTWIRRRRLLHDATD